MKTRYSGRKTFFLKLNPVSLKKTIFAGRNKHSRHMDKRTTVPGLFGQRHASRDYTQEKFWGKNQFNSSFPASLVAYMSYKIVPMS